MNILSVGCGAMLDAIGALYARAGWGDANEASFNYKGIDLIKWAKQIRFDSEPNINIDFEEADALKWFGENTAISQNIIFFHKVINEFNNKQIDKLSDSLQKCTFLSDDIFICANSGEKTRYFDSRKIKRIADAINIGNDYLVIDCVRNLINRPFIMIYLKENISVSQVTISNVWNLIKFLMDNPQMISENILEIR